MAFHHVCLCVCDVLVHCEGHIGVLLYCSVSYFLRYTLSQHLILIDWLASKLLGFSCLFSSAGIAGMCSWFSPWVSELRSSGLHSKRFAN